MSDYSRFLTDDGFAIFLFHGVIRTQCHQVRNYTKKHLTLDKFASVVRNLSAYGSAVSMADIVLASRGELVLPKRAFTITFDDGFENNYSVAAPVLEDLAIPTMFYITTGFIDKNQASWIDMIEYAVEWVNSVNLVLPFREVEGTFETREEKIQLLDDIRSFVKNVSHIEPYEFAYDIWDQLGIDTFEPDPALDQKMSWAQVRELSQNTLFTIGGHSHTHPILEYLDQSELEHEIAISLEKLQEHLDVPIKHYSYPEGLANCYSDRVIRVLQRHGIVCSPSAEHGTNRVGDDLFHLKRIMVA